MSSGFPPKTHMKLISVSEGKVKDVAHISTGGKCSVCGFDLSMHQTGESKLQAPVLWGSGVLGHSQLQRVQTQPVTQCHCPKLT